MNKREMCRRVEHLYPPGQTPEKLFRYAKSMAACCPRGGAVYFTQTNQELPVDNWIVLDSRPAGSTPAKRVRTAAGRYYDRWDVAKDSRGLLKILNYLAATNYVIWDMSARILIRRR